MISDSPLEERATAVEIGGLVDGVGAPVVRAAYALRSKPSWITLSAVEGTGNSQVNVTAPVYKGRVGRSGSITVNVEDLTEDVAIQQSGSNIWDVTTQSLAFVKTGEAKKFTGNANLASIAFAVDSDASGHVTVNGQKYTVTQAAGDATLSVSPTALTFAAAGETKQIKITTNTAWTIS